MSRENKLRYKHKAEHKKRKTWIVELMSMLSFSSFPRWNKESYARALLYCALVHLTSLKLSSRLQCFLFDLEIVTHKKTETTSTPVCEFHWLGKRTQMRRVFGWFSVHATHSQLTKRLPKILDN